MVAKEESLGKMGIKYFKKYKNVIRDHSGSFSHKHIADNYAFVLCTTVKIVLILKQ